MFDVIGRSLFNTNGLGKECKRLETKSAVKGAIILVIILFWKETMEQGLGGLRAG